MSGDSPEFKDIHPQPDTDIDTEIEIFHDLTLDEDDSENTTPITDIPPDTVNNNDDYIENSPSSDGPQHDGPQHDEPSPSIDPAVNDHDPYIPQEEPPLDLGFDEEFAPDPDRARDAKARGNKLFGEGDYLEALECYAEALIFVPDSDVKDRALYHNNKAAAHIMIKDWDDAIYETNCVLQLDPSNIKAIGRRAKSYEAKEQYQEAIEDYKLLMELEPNVPRHKQKVDQLTKKAEEKFEEQKKEMVTKLKGWGDSVLGLFGMSTDNFEFKQDPNTGSYSVNFKQQ